MKDYSDIAGLPDSMAAFLYGIPLSANSAEGAPKCGPPRPAQLT